MNIRKLDLILRNHGGDFHEINITVGGEYMPLPLLDPQDPVENLLISVKICQARL